MRNLPLSNASFKQAKHSLFAAHADLVAAFLLATLNMLVLSMCWKLQGIQADESTYIYGALEMLRGKAIYRDFWVFYPPGIFFLTMGVFALLGKSLLALRMVLALCASATAAVLYLLGRQFMSRFSSAVASVLFILLGVNLWPVFGHHWTSTFALVFSALCMVSFLRQRRTGLLAWSGVFCGITILLQMHKGVPLMMGSLLVLLIRNWSGGSILRSLGAFSRVATLYVLTSLLPVSIALLYLLKIGVFTDAVNAVIVFPYRRLADLTSPDYGVPYAAYSVSVLSHLMRFVKLGEATNICIRAVAGLIAFAAPISAVFVVGMPALGKRKKEEREVTGFVAVATLACLAASISRPDFHHLLTSIPMGYVTLVFLVSSLRVGSWSGHWVAALKGIRGLLFTAVLAPAALVGLGTLLFAFHVEPVFLGSSLGFVSIVTERQPDSLLRTPQELLIGYVKASTAPEEKILAMPFSPFVYYLTERRSVTRFPMLLSSMNDAGQMAEVIADLEADRTRLVILDPTASWDQFKAALPYADERQFRENPLLRYIAGNYRKVADYGGFVVMERVSAPVR
ncbi:MAG: hypothetical protein C4532_18970 [Candidatus Abyssobacteria bacterium SURF_17]|uniref:Glycosyltransferase RgtA/B/C/D-like domain-containing protein n=1 Tax=Candidatus Abyssobacteria bacterium SURF_17 TaxID=2093361 RepID=A0A419EP34_9BACT|nr:MAG: hypothetical protein C4532_18970 [Candidatus Abyssubacteria bacterium SURF_17]